MSSAEKQQRKAARKLPGKDQGLTFWQCFAKDRLYTKDMPGIRPYLYIIPFFLAYFVLDFSLRYTYRSAGIVGVGYLPAFLFTLGWALVFAGLVFCLPKVPRWFVRCVPLVTFVTIAVTHSGFMSMFRRFFSFSVLTYGGTGSFMQASYIHIALKVVAGATVTVLLMMTSGRLLKVIPPKPVKLSVILGLVAAVLGAGIIAFTNYHFFPVVDTVVWDNAEENTESAAYHEFSDTTNFITANWRPLLKMLTIAILPVCAIQALCLNNLTSMMYGELASDSDDTMGILAGFGLNYGATMILGMIASLFLLSIVYALMKLYHATNEDGTPVNEDLTKMTFKEFLPYARRQMGAAWKSVLAFMLFFVVNILLVVAIIAVLQAANVGVFMILFAWFVVLIPPAMLLIPVYSFEPIGFWAGMRKAFVYGFKTWGGIVAITFVVGLITNVICGFLSVPYMLTAMAKAFLAIENSDGFSFVNSTWFSLISYLSALLYIYVCYVGYSALLIAIAYQYGHACSALDIDNFDHEDKDFDDFDKDATNEDNF